MLLKCAKSIASSHNKSPAIQLSCDVIPIAVSLKVALATFT